MWNYILEILIEMCYHTIEVIKMLKPKDVAKTLNVTVRTLQSWDRQGVLPALRTPAGRRWYSEEQINKFLNKENSQNGKKMNIAYSRVSSRQQKTELENQENFIKNHVNGNGMIIGKYFSDIGSGLNYKRENFLKMIELVMERKVDKIFVTYKDRVVRFGFDFMEWFCQRFGTEIIVLNDRKTSPENELVNDLILIIHVFSCRIYGLRKYKKTIKEEMKCQRN